MTYQNAMMIEPNEFKTPFNWAGVSFLLFMIGIPAIPAVFIVALVVMGSGVESPLSEMINARYFDMPLVIICHGISGIVFFVTMPFQFSPKLRQAKPRYHKINGYFAFISACVMAASGVWMHHVFLPNEFGARYVSLVIVAMAIFLAFVIAVKYAIKKDVKQHQRWVYFAAAASLAVVSPLFLEIIAMLMGNVGAELMHDYGRLIGLVLNFQIAHWLFKKNHG